MQDAGQMEVWTAKANENRKAELVIGPIEYDDASFASGCIQWMEEQTGFFFHMN